MALIIIVTAFLTALEEAYKRTCKMAGTTGTNLLKNFQEVVANGNAQMVF